ncbi:hydrogenase iron-sulfur subunit [Desulfothermobacter acidiphilus]|uniref:hydrogenase iron-sulfur subunit n=1 Tax=Desulfothermobacter acidiphilus TaxID=1938353 RepID=UPI003F8CC9A7
MPIKEWEPRIIAFLCHWCSYAAADLAGVSRYSYPANVSIIRVPCSSRVNPQMILRAFAGGADGVLVAGCHLGDCHYVKGNFYARRRFWVLRKLLEFVGVEPVRFQVHWIAGSEGNKFAGTIAEMVEEVRSLGPSSFAREVETLA